MKFVPSDHAVCVLGIIDPSPKYTIEKVQFREEFKDLFVNVDRQGYYWVNSDLDSQITFNASKISDLAARSVRLRAQFENSDLELFPEMSPCEAGFFRQFLENDLDESLTMSSIDLLLVGSVASLLWQMNKVMSLPTIKQIIPLNATEIVKIVEPIICDELKRASS